MPLFYEGDRVRLGTLRGGVVVRVDGRLKVRFHDSRTTLWLDHCVPDEGPDGRIYPNTWNSCLTCSNQTTSEDFCINCEARAQGEHAAVAKASRPRWDRAYSIHLAGPVEQDGRSVHQHCARCGVQLVGYLDGGEKRQQPPAGTYREGTLLERGGLGLVVLTRVAQPSCQPQRVQARTA